MLYHATVTLRSTVDGTLLDTVTDRFGLRTLEIDGPYFVLNGARHFLLGMGDDYGYETEAPPMNKTLYMQRFDAFASYGFNFIRLHSHWEAPGYFEAADEHGFFISPGWPSLAPASSASTFNNRAKDFAEK